MALDGKNNSKLTPLVELNLGEAFLTPVHNFEVAEFHTYYVGEVGVWVHNANCDKAEALEVGIKKAELKAACFSGDTRVLMEGGKYKQIEYVAVGDKVLSRCEFTGEMAYKKVVEKFHHECEYRPGDSYDYEIPAYMVVYSTTKPERGGNVHGVIHAKAEDPICLTNYSKWTTVREVRSGDGVFTSDRAQVMVLRVETDHDLYRLHWTEGWGALHVTPEHPIWVVGKGWTAVRDLRLEDQFLTSDGAQAIVQRLDTDCETYNVYNLHVEDFHTYFVDSGIWVHNQKITELTRVDYHPVVDAAAKPIENPYLTDKTSALKGSASHSF